MPSSLDRADGLGRHGSYLMVAACMNSEGVKDVHHLQASRIVGSPTGNIDVLQMRSHAARGFSAVHV